MPKAKLPSTAKGWLVAIVASLVGLLAGFLTINCLERIMRAWLP